MSHLQWILTCPRVIFFILSVGVTIYGAFGIILLSSPCCLADSEMFFPENNLIWNLFISNSLVLLGKLSAFYCATLKFETLVCPKNFQTPNHIKKSEIHYTMKELMHLSNDPSDLRNAFLGIYAIFIFMCSAENQFSKINFFGWRFNLQKTSQSPFWWYWFPLGEELGLL